MDPIVIVPVALAVAWAATRKKKKTTKKTELPPVADEPEEPLPLPPTQDPVGPYDGPGGGEPWRPGGPGQKGPKPFPGPSGGPKPPEFEDPAPVEIYPGTTAEDIEQQPNAAYGLFISSDCETVYEGEKWYSDVFLPKARELVLSEPAAFHHPVGVIYEILVMFPREARAFEQANTLQDDLEPPPAELCLEAWGEFVYGDRTPMGTYSGWVTERSDPADEFWDYSEWFGSVYPMLTEFLVGLYSMLWDESDLAEIFQRDWPGDEPSGDFDFNPASE